MNNKRMALIITISMILSSLFACSKTDGVNKAISYDTPYYSVTTGSIEKNRDMYMDLNIKIPKIAYYNIDKDDLIDSVNEEIETSINKIIDEAKSNAYETFKSYIESVKQNTTDDDMVFGHTSTKDLIIPGLHNKNIIVVEKSETESVSEESNRKIASSSNPDKDIATKSFPKFDDKRINQETDNIKIDTKTSSKSETTFMRERKEFNIKVSTKSSLRRNFDLNDLTSYSYLIRQYIPTTIECNYDVKCLDGDYLSIMVEINESRTTNKITRLFYNIDLNNKIILSIKDILGENYKDICTKTINTTIDNWSDEQKSVLIDNYNIEEYIDENTPFFINNNHIPVVQVEKFVISIGSTGYHEFQIIN